MRCSLQTNLKKAQIGKTGLEVTRIGMGGAPIGKGDIDIAVESLETAYRAVSYTHLRAHET